MNKSEFKIDSRPDLEFRTAFKSSLEILSFQMTASFDDADKMSKTFDWLLRRVEVKIAGQWVPVKEGGNVYNPAVLEDDLTALQQIISEMLSFVKDVFQKSRESSQKQQ